MGRFSELIAADVEERQLSAAALARLAGRSRSTGSRWLSGDQLPDGPTLRRLREGLDWSTERFERARNAIDDDLEARAGGVG